MSGDQIIDFGSFSEIVNQSAIDKKIEFQLYFSKTCVKFSLKEDQNKNVYVSNFLCNVGDLEYSLNDLSIEDYFKDDFNIKNTNKFNLNIDKYLRNKSNILKLNVKPKVYRDGFFFQITSIDSDEESLKSYFKNRLSEYIDDKDPLTLEIDRNLIINDVINGVVNSLNYYNKISRSSISFFHKIKRDFSNIKYIGPIRQTAERSYNIGNFKDIGFSGEHAAQILAVDRDLRNRVEESFKEIGVAENLQVYLRKDQRSFELKLKTANTERGVNFKDVGCGTSQILPIIVQSQMAQKESLIILEQPEVHLHPKTQAELADFFIEHAKRKRRFLIETHSDYLIERFRYHLAKGDILPEDMFIYYVEQDPALKCSKVTRIEINSKGQYVNMPADYITNFRLNETRNITKRIMQNLIEKDNRSEE